MHRRRMLPVTHSQLGTFSVRLADVVAVVVAFGLAAIGRIETAILEIEIAVFLVLVPRQHVVADDLPRFEIASAVEAVASSMLPAPL
jgi:hypothetical protein